PEPGFRQHTLDTQQRLLQGFFQRIEEPLEPWGDIELTTLRSFKMVIVGIATRHDRRTQRIETHRLLLCLRQRTISHRTGHAPIAIVEGMQRDQPQVRYACTQQRIQASRRMIEPGNKLIELTLQYIAWRRFKMHLGTINPAGYHLHWLLATQG